MKNLEDLMLKIMFITMILFVAYIVLIAPESVKASNVPVELKQSGLEALQLEIEGNSNYSLGECKLSFYSERYKKEVSAPDWFMDRVRDYDCKDKQWLIRLAHYESDFNPEARNGYFAGLYQIGIGDTKDFCKSNGRYASDEDCALFLVSWNPHTQFEVVDRYINSFRDLL